MSDDPRWGDDPRQRDDDPRDRDPVDPRDAFLEKLDLPRGLERELVHERDREYTLRGSESRTLSIVGTFRVVSSRDLQDHDGRPTRARAISGTSASRVSYGPCRSMDTAITQSC